mmetsp:Transcript_4062/g.7173  ORF Transcript_4062/g.7173 Transcript_4062/m.7173 type:complete len:82 (-) Transcript_4062:368-613(-)
MNKRRTRKMKSKMKRRKRMMRMPKLLGNCLAQICKCLPLAPVSLGKTPSRGKHSCCHRGSLALAKIQSSCFDPRERATPAN